MWRGNAHHRSLWEHVDKYEVPGTLRKESMKSWNSVNSGRLVACVMLDKKFQVGPFDVAFSAFADYVRIRRRARSIYLTVNLVKNAVPP